MLSVQNPRSVIMFVALEASVGRIDESNLERVPELSSCRAHLRRENRPTPRPRATCHSQVLSSSVVARGGLVSASRCACGTASGPPPRGRPARHGRRARALGARGRGLAWLRRRRAIVTLGTRRPACVRPSVASLGGARASSRGRVSYEVEVMPGNLVCYPVEIIDVQCVVGVRTRFGR